MPKGPKGEWRPADPAAWAAHIGRLATGEIEETTEPPADQRQKPPVPAAARAGGRARAAKLTPEERSASAKRASAARWQKEAS